MLSVIEEKGRMQPRIKHSDDPEKTTIPDLKRVIRLFNDSGKTCGDVLFSVEESVRKGSITGYYPSRFRSAKAYLTFYSRRELLVPIFENGQLIYKVSSLKAIQENRRQNLKQIATEVKRLRNPILYPIHLSRILKDLKKRC